MRAVVVRRAEARCKDLGGGVWRTVLANSPGLMTVEVRFETGAAGAVHTHPHLQNTYVVSGRFRFTVGGVTVEVGAGDTIAFLEDVPHGTECLEAGVLLDVFSPARADFL
jgi:quercetin dioxygenase-like cupin family protein